MAEASEVIPAVILWTIAIVGLSGNCLTMWVISTNPHRSSTDTLVLNLATADLFFIITDCGSAAINAALQHWPFGAAACEITSYASIVTLYVSSYTIVLLALERMLTRIYPNTDRHRHHLAAITVLWLSGCAIGIYAFPITEYVFEYPNAQRLGPFSVTQDGQFRFNPKRGYCNFHPAKVHVYTKFALSYVIPGCLAVVFTCVAARRSAASHCSLRRGELDVVYYGADASSVTRMTSFVVAAFVCLWPAHYAMELITVHNTRALDSIGWPESFWLLVGSLCLAYLSFSIRPIIYAVLSTHFRTEFRLACCCRSGDVFAEAVLRDSPVSRLAPGHAYYSRTPLYFAGGTISVSTHDVTLDFLESAGVAQEDDVMQCDDCSKACATTTV
ncbi:PREDICTED: allatostatin-A receptor-like [Priapulus caudatus]|uniref:Allatostatin-A receptor-like n=1 Tax=Priapulus caudatus TaxID=37621 RepID=A0ABM1F355_PRICU|nr:PREDICTED: allatostatin-A receptor-like [Priapulus caudatus]